jgi:hypothetical protein
MPLSKIKTPAIQNSTILAEDIADGTIGSSKIANVSSSHVTTALGYTPQNRAGGTYFSSSGVYQNVDTNTTMNSVSGRKTWFRYCTPLNSQNRYLHIKTSYFIGDDGFWSIKGYGYHYGRAMTINSQWVGYCYSNGGGSGIHTIIATNQSNYGQHALATGSYKSSDQYVVIVADTTGASTPYFCGFELDFFQSTPATNAANLTATATTLSASTTGAY